MTGVVETKYEYMEVLPASCPPGEAVLKGYEEVWRFVTSNPPTPEDFESLAATKPPPPGFDACRWASCSVFLTKAAAFAKIKLPKARERFSHIVKFRITEKCGHTLEKKKHIDFWRFNTFVPTIIDVEALK